MTTVNVNTATAPQLSVLLGLSTEEAARVIASRPFSTRESLVKALPARFASSPPNLDIPLLDINTQTTDQLTTSTGISRDTAEKLVAGRPYFVMAQVLVAVGAQDYQRLLPYYSTPNFGVTDKLTGRQVLLTADPSRVIISRTNREDTEALPPSLGAVRLFGPAESSIYDVYSLPESEAATNAVANIEHVYQKRAIPAFVDNSASRRYLNPQYCVVQFQPDVTRQQAWSIMASLRLKLEEAHRCPGLYTVRIPDAKSNPSAMAEAINELNSHREVKFAEPNYLGFNDREQNAGAGAITPDVAWNFIMTRIPEAWSMTTGSPDVVIAIVDSGVDGNHPAFKDAVLAPTDGESFNFTPGGGPLPDDEEGHGTFIAGLLVGNGQAGVTGICPGCRILPLKVLLTGEVNSYATRRDAILFASQKVQPPQKLIINMSWKTTGDINLIRDACDEAASRGALLVASAGNMPETANESHYPSDYPAVISVAAVTPARKRADYSYYGDLVDVSAPGGDESDPQKSIMSSAPGGKSTTGCGTSFAAPHVAGIAALAASVYPSLTAPQLRFCVENGTDSLTDPGMGNGLCNAKSALDLAGGGPGSITGKPNQPRISGQPSVVGGPSNRNDTDGALRDLNTLAASALASRYGLLALTADILVARRPFTDVTQIQGTLGLTDQQFNAIQQGRNV